MKRKTFLVSLTFALVASALAQEASPKITYTSTAVPVGRALGEISKQANLHLEAMPAIANEILILRVKDVSLDDLLKQIATVTSGEWKQVDGGYQLLPNLTVRRQEDLAERNAYTAGLKKSLDEMVKSLNPPPAPKSNSKTKTADEDEAAEIAAQFGFGAAQSPSGKAVIRLLQGIGAQNLAAVDARTRIVYSTNPTRMQRPLPGNWKAILTQLVQEQNAYALKLQKEREAEPVDTEETEQMKKLREMFGDFEDQAKPIVGVPTKAILVCSRQMLFGGLSTVLKVYNDKGQVIITGQQTLTSSDSDFQAYVQEKTAEAKGEKKPQTNEKPIEFSDITKELQSSSNIMTMATGGVQKMSDELKTRMLHPEMYDPLSFADSEALIEIANRRNEQLVADLPDEMQSIFTMVGQTAKLTPSSYLGQIAREVAVDEKDGWLTAKPANPAEARSKRFDRVALGTFIRAVDAKGACSLDDLAAYAMKSESPMENQGTLSYIMLFAPNAMQAGLSGMTNWDMLRFYGSLSPTKKKDLIDGGRLPFAQLSVSEAAAVRQMAFGPDQNLTLDEDGKQDENGLTKFYKQMFMRAAGGDYRTEPTEVMPNGLPPQGYVELHFSNTHVAKPAGNVPAMMKNATLGADELALFKYMTESESMQQVAGMMPHIDEVKLGSRKVYDFKFVVAQGVSMSQTLNDDSFDKDAGTVRMTNLPDDFQKKIAERMEAIKKLPFFDPAFLGGGRQVTPP